MSDTRNDNSLADAYIELHRLRMHLQSISKLESILCFTYSVDASREVIRLALELLRNLALDACTIGERLVNKSFEARVRIAAENQDGGKDCGGCMQDEVMMSNQSLDAHAADDKSPVCAADRESHHP